MHPGVAQHEVSQGRTGRRRPHGRAVGRSGLHQFRSPVGQLRPQRQEQVAGVLDPSPVLALADSHSQGPAGIGELVHRRPDGCGQVLNTPGALAAGPAGITDPAIADAGAPLDQLREGQRSELAQKVGDPLGIGAHPPVGRQVLELGLDLGHDLVVEQFGDTPVPQ